MEKLYTVSKIRTGADNGSDHELLIAKFAKMAVWRGLTNSCEKKRSEKQRRKRKISI